MPNACRIEKRLKDNSIGLRGAVGQIGSLIGDCGLYTVSANPLHSVNVTRHGFAGAAKL